MQTRLSLVDLAKRVQDTKDNKRDYVVPTNLFRMRPDATFGYDDAIYDTGPIAHEHLGQKLGIPKPYYDRMLNEDPDLLATNVNHWLSRSDGRNMLRTVGNTARAFLSDRYRPLDNDMILEAVLPTLLEHGEYEILSCEITERRMYVSVASRKLEGQLKKGDVVRQGITISNSEVGLGSVSVDPMIYILACLNGAIMASAMKKYHVGKRNTESDYSFLTREAIDTDNKAFLLRVRDTVANAFSEIEFKQRLELMSITADHKIQKAVDETVVDVTSRFNMSQAESDSVLRNLINGGDLSQWGMSNAVTAIANDVQDYDRAIELQRIGGKIIEMPHKEWVSLAH